MSAWSWVARIGGYVAAPFTGGASIPIGEAIAQGINNRDAAGEANETLQAGNQRAIDAYGVVKPFVDTGQQANQTLAGLMGFAPSGGGAPMAEAAPMMAPAQTGRTNINNQPVIGTAGPRGGGTLADLGQASQQQTASSFRGSNAVRVQAPTGQVFMVPSERLSEALAQGGKQVS